MGWDYTKGATKRSLIDDLTRDHTDQNIGTRTLQHHVSDNTLWTVRETTYPDGTIQRWIGCDLLESRPNYGWGSKSMEEAMHPFVYTCPLEFLDLVPKVVCPEWRTAVRRQHQGEGGSALRVAVLGIAQP